MSWDIGQLLVNAARQKSTLTLSLENRVIATSQQGMRVSKFKIFGRETTHSKTRHGVAAWSKIRNEQGEIVGELDDQAEAIVAHVTFKSPEIRKEFLEEAKMALKDVVSPTHGEEYFISEYARTMSMDADLDYVEELKKRK